VNLELLGKVPPRMDPALAEATARQANKHESSDGWAIHGTGEN